MEHWLFIQQPGDPGSVRSPLSGGHGTVGELGGWVGTLLGPEGTGAVRLFFSPGPDGPRRLVRRVACPGPPVS